MNTHRLKLTFEDERITATLICPPSGCQPISSCGNCGRQFDDGSEPCDSCAIDQEMAGECWLAQWAEASGSDELLEWMEGDVTIEVNGIFDDERPTVEVYEPEQNISTLTFPA